MIALSNYKADATELAERKCFREAESIGVQGVRASLVRSPVTVNRARIGAFTMVKAGHHRHVAVSNS